LVFEALPAVLLGMLAQCSAGTLLNKSHPRNQITPPGQGLGGIFLLAKYLGRALGNQLATACSDLTVSLASQAV
jgi:hypothetical protein